MFTSYDGMHGAAEGISIQQEIRDFRIGWYLQSISVWNLKSEKDKAAKRKEAIGMKTGVFQDFEFCELVECQ